MKVKFTGNTEIVGKRIVGAHEWTNANGYVVDVADKEQALDLISQRNFEVDKSDALCTLEGVGPSRAAALALAGVGSLEDLATLDKEGVERVAQEVGVPATQVRAWAKQATRKATETVVEAPAAEPEKQEEE
jgi:predicted flap endonuclease-1-like 5' DNA nuclease